MQLTRMTGPDVKHFVTPHTVALLPIGAHEQHSSHLPVSMDIAAASAVAAMVEAGRADRTLLLPGIPYGASDHHLGFAGTVSVGTEVLAGALAEIVASFNASSGVRRFLILNGHGGNVPAMRWALDLVSRSLPSVEVRALSYWDALFDALDAAEEPRHGPMGHADRYESSIALALWAGELDILPGSVDGFTDGLPAWVQTSAGFHARTKAGGVGDPSGASEDEGRRYVELAAERLIRLVDEWT